jgi:DNA replication protein DnaC
MRTEENFQKVWFEQALQKFPPRLQRDLKNITFPKDLQSGEAKSTFIYGGIATGKTVRACFMMLQEIKHIYLNELQVLNSILFVSFPDLFAEIKDTFNDSTKKESTIMNRYMNAHLLVLDDFLTTRPTEWVMDILYHLINHRYDYMLKTIITCNLSLEELEKKLGDQRITSRIDRMCEIERKDKNWK